MKTNTTIIRLAMLLALLLPAALSMAADAGGQKKVVIACDWDFAPYEFYFQSQIRWGDSIAVTSYVTNWGNKSLRVKQQIINTVTGQPCATCSTVMSGYSRSLHASAGIPDEIKERVERFDKK